MDQATGCCPRAPKPAGSLEATAASSDEDQGRRQQPLTTEDAQQSCLGASQELGSRGTELSSVKEMSGHGEWQACLVGGASVGGQHALVWSVPAGMPDHQQVVAWGTVAVTLACTVCLLWSLRAGGKPGRASES